MNLMRDIWYAIVNTALRLRNWIFELEPRELELENYKTVLHDDFKTLNPLVWNTKQPWGEYHPEQPWVCFRAPVTTGSDGLRLWVDREEEIINGKVFHARGSVINTAGLFLRRFGYFEVTAKLPSSGSDRPAFWLCGENSWPPEIDIFEAPGSNNDPHRWESSVHYNIDNEYKTKKHFEDLDLTKTFNKYALLWEGDVLKWYFNGWLVRVKRINIEKDYNFNQPHYILLQNLLDKNYAKATLPAAMHVKELIVKQKI